MLVSKVNCEQNEFQKSLQYFLPCISRVSPLKMVPCISTLRCTSHPHITRLIPIVMITAIRRWYPTCTLSSLPHRWQSHASEIGHCFSQSDVCTGQDRVFVREFGNLFAGKVAFCYSFCTAGYLIHENTCSSYFTRGHNFELMYVQLTIT